MLNFEADFGEVYRGYLNDKTYVGDVWLYAEGEWSWNCILDGFGTDGTEPTKEAAMQALEQAVRDYHNK